MATDKEIWLVLDDSAADRRRFLMALSDEHDVEVALAATVTEAKEILISKAVSVFLVDFFLKAGMTSSKLISEVRSNHPNLPVVVVSGHAGVEIELYLAGSDQIVPKPLSLLDFKNALLNGVRQAKARREAAVYEQGAMRRSFLPASDTVGHEPWEKLYQLMKVGSLEDTLACAREMKVRYALNAAKGNKTKAASVLKIERQTLYKSGFKLA